MIILLGIQALPCTTGRSYIVVSAKAEKSFIWQCLHHLGLTSAKNQSRMVRVLRAFSQSRRMRQGKHEE